MTCYYVLILRRYITFQGGRVVEGTSGKVLKPSRLDILGAGLDPVIKPEPVKSDVIVKAKDPVETSSSVPVPSSDNNDNNQKK
jgi:hypothetical protein